MSSRGPYRRHTPQFRLQLFSDIRSGLIGRREAAAEVPIATSYQDVLRRSVEFAQYASEDYRTMPKPRAS